MGDLRELIYSINFDADYDGIKEAVNHEEKLDKGLRETLKSSKGIGDTWRDNNGRLRDVNGRFVKINDETKKVNENSQSFNKNIKTVLKTLAGGMVIKKTLGFLKDSMNTFSDFEQGMANVRATMALTGEQGEKDFKILWSAAKEMGRTTKFTAKDSADALNYIAQYGYKAEKSVTMLPEVLNLASAGGLELADASRIAMQSMASLGLKADELGKLNDQLAKTAQTSGTNVAQMGEAVTTVGGVAMDSGLNLESLNAQLGILADSAYTGSKGGTALRNVLLNITSNDKVVEMMGELEEKFGFIGVVDKQTGKFNDFDKIMKSLGKTLKKFTPAQQQAIKAVIGGKENVQGLNVLLEGNSKVLENGRTKYEEYRDAIKDSDGAAKEAADTQTKTVKGAWQELQSAMQDVQITMFDTEGASQGLQDVIRGIAGAMPGIANELQYVTNKTKEFISFVIENKEPIIAVLTSIGSVLATLKVLKTIESAKASLSGLSGLLGGLPVGKVGLIIAGIGALAGLFVYAYRNSEMFRDGVNATFNILKDIAGFLSDSFISIVSGIACSFSDSFKAIWENLGQFIGGVKDTLGGIIDFVAGVFTADWGRAWDGIKNVLSGIIDTISGSFKSFFNFVTSGLNAVIRGINSIKFKVPDWVPGIGGKGFDGFGIPEIPRLAKGTNNWEGGIARIHDQYGGEIVDIPSGSRVIPHDKSIIEARNQGRLEGGGHIAINMPPIEININGSSNPESTAMAVKNELDRYLNEKFATLNLQMGYSTI